MALLPAPILPLSLETSLKTTTRSALAERRRRARAALTPAEGAVINRYEVSTDQGDLLYCLWARLLAQHEVLLLGNVAKSPTAFVEAFRRMEVLLIYDPEEDWQHGEGVMALCWSDQVIPRASFKLSFYISPPYRHPVMSTQLACGMLRHLFEVRLFENVWGLTPVTNRLALRFYRRLGLSPAHHIYRPKSVLDPLTGEPMDAFETWLSRTEWHYLTERSTT